MIFRSNTGNEKAEPVAKHHQWEMDTNVVNPARLDLPEYGRDRVPQMGGWF